MLGITDANGHTTNFTYDAFGRVTQTTFPSSFYESYAYDAIGNLTSKTDRKGQTIQCVYDALNRLTQKNYPDSTSVTYTSVSYAAKTWSTGTVQADKLRPPGQPGLRGTCLAAICLDLRQDPAALTSDIREALSHGQLTRDGTEDINGVNAIKLVAVVTKPQASGQFAFVGRTTLWVNPATYLPVRINTNLTATLGHGQTTHIVGTRDVSWLPATSANLADLRVPIPAGFTQVSRR